MAYVLFPLTAPPSQATGWYHSVHEQRRLASGGVLTYFAREAVPAPLVTPEGSASHRALTVATRVVWRRRGVRFTKPRRDELAERVARSAVRCRRAGGRFISLYLDKAV